MEQAVAVAQAFLSGDVSPLEAGSRMTRVGIAQLPCWSETGGAEGPFSAFYGASDAADECHFLGEDVERWHPDVRERKRTELAEAERQWRGPVDAACRALIACANAG
jgi:hypothetical protein